jgi:hypothetical protein
MERRIAAGEWILAFVYKVKRTMPSIRNPATFGVELA